MVVTDGDGRVLFYSPTKPGSCADLTHTRQSRLVRLLAEGPPWRFSRMSATRAWVRRVAAG
ncbi:transposase family protein [Streptomyces actinomycinicus]|nr:transposase family protein [Streptomyces actinomycinicus]